MKICVLGAMGKMGGVLCDTITNACDMQLQCAVTRNLPDGTVIGYNPAYPYTTDIQSAIENCDVVIDFTTPEYTCEVLKITAQTKTAHIIGTTGFTAQQEQNLHKAAQNTPIVYAANFSLGINILQAFSEKLGAILPSDDFDAEIIEQHHRHKVDSPSGTALVLGQSVAQGRGVDLDTVKCDSRSGIIGQRPMGEIGFATIRGGGVIGDHTVQFASAMERIEITHKAQSRDVFAFGAITAAKWALQQPDGLYTMKNVLDI